MKNIVNQKMSRGQGNEFLNKLEAAGLSAELAQRVIDSKGNNLSMKVVRLIMIGGFEPFDKLTASLNPQWRSARKIMGRNFFGIEEAIKYFGVNPSKQQLSALSEIPFSEAVLEECKNTHILVAVFPLSILNIYRKLWRYKNCDENKWYRDQWYSKEKGWLGWHLVCKTEVPDSTSFSRDWERQFSLLRGSDDEIPTAHVIVFTIIGYYLATGERLFRKLYVRTSSKTLLTRDNFLNVGKFESSEPHINDLQWLDDCGLASSRLDSTINS